MASEIDEAAAEKHCRWIIANPGAFAGKDYAAHNAARVALAWKARAEAAEAEVKRLENVIVADYQLRKEMREYRGTYGYMEGRDILTRRS